MDITAVLFIGAVIIAITQAIKILSRKVVSGGVTILVALVVGAVVGALSGWLGLVPAISPAAGIIIALAAVGVHTTASAVNTTAV